MRSSHSHVPDLSEATRWVTTQDAHRRHYGLVEMRRRMCLVLLRSSAVSTTM
jgi:hypothetical protein